MKRNEIHLGGTARSHDDVVAIYKLGLQFAEIPIPDPDNFEVLKEDYQTLGEDLGLYYLCHGPLEGDPNDLTALGNTYLAKVMKVLSIMPGLDMRLLTLHFWMDPRFVTKEAIAYKIELLKKIIGRAEETGITICLENLSERATHLESVFKWLPRLNLTLDFGHAQLLTRHNTSYEIMAKFPEKIRHIHLHDNRGGTSPDDDLHLPVGEGTIDFEKIFQRLKAIGYHHTITLELRPKQIEGCLGYVKKLLLFN